MRREEIKVCVMRVGGTNCDAETQRAFQELGVQAEFKIISQSSAAKLPEQFTIAPADAINKLLKEERKAIIGLSNRNMIELGKNYLFL